MNTIKDGRLKELNCIGMMMTFNFSYLFETLKVTKKIIISMLLLNEIIIIKNYKMEFDF